MKKETILGYDNSYEIQQVELGSVQNKPYLRFYFTDEIKAEYFRSYLKITLKMLANDSEIKIQFQELYYNDNFKNTVALVGNIKQAIDFFNSDDIFSDKTKEILEDPAEVEIQKILKKSQKCLSFSSTIPSDKHTDLNFFNPNSSKLKEGRSKMESIKTFFGFSN